VINEIEGFKVQWFRGSKVKADKYCSQCVLDLASCQTPFGGTGLEPDEEMMPLEESTF
jgi:hypothetical protein